MSNDISMTDNQLGCSLQILAITTGIIWHPFVSVDMKEMLFFFKHWIFCLVNDDWSIHSGGWDYAQFFYKIWLKCNRYAKVA